MCDHKLSSEEVPTKFSEWLLGMGCPPEKVPTAEKIVEMCRGQYYMVWRSLMEHVEAKDVIRQKRLHVFCDDVYKWKRKNAFNKADTNAVMPAELLLWHQHNDVKEKVTNAEERVTQARQSLNQLMEKISNKLSHRNLSRQALQDVQRRAWLLQQVADELRTKKENLQETRAIADSLCSTDEEVDVQSKLEKYIAHSRRGGSQPAASTSMLATNPVASSSVVSNGDVNDSEEQLSWLMKCRGDALWPQLAERRAGLVAELTNDPATKKDSIGPQPQSVVAHTATLQCSLALEALKNRAHIKTTRQRLAAAVSDLSSYLSGAACELLVVRCERARACGRRAALHACLRDVAARGGAFAAPGACTARATPRQIAAVDKAIESKKEDLKRLVSSLATTEKKIYSARECLINIFNGFHKDLSVTENDKYRGQAEVSECASLRRYCGARRQRRRDRLQLSMDLDVSDVTSFTETDNPKFADELRTYLKKFNLEKNRKLILENGVKIWTFESVSAASMRLNRRWKDISTPNLLICPSTSLHSDLRLLADQIQAKGLMEAAVEAAKTSVDKKTVHLDVAMKSNEEELIVDKIKKRLSDNLLSLQKTNKTLDLGKENLAFWSGNEMKKLMSQDRQVDGKSYKDYEEIYMMNIS